MIDSMKSIKRIISEQQILDMVPSMISRKSKYFINIALQILLRLEHMNHLQFFKHPKRKIKVFALEVVEKKLNLVVL